MTNDEIRAIWIENGGSIHGPIVETCTMPEEKLFKFVRRLIEKECPCCEGLGAHPIDPPVKCGKCNGTGTVPNVKLRGE